MGRFLGMGCFAAALVALAGPAGAGSSALGPGETNWFYACGGNQIMNISVRHRDGTVTRMSLAPGQRLRGPVRQGDVQAWRCGGPVPRGAGYLTVVTLPHWN